MVYFHFEEVNILLKNRKKLKAYISKLVNQENLKLNRLDFVFCSDAYLLNLNQQFLRHDTYTDILTFDLSENENELTAEIYISTDRVKENAVQFKTGTKEELHRVIFHGLLHLFGYGDHSEDEKKVMREKENLLLQRYFKEQ